MNNNDYNILTDKKIPRGQTLKNLIGILKKYNISELGQLEKFLELATKYPYHYSEQYVSTNASLKQENEQLKEQLKEVRKQVCDKIRKKLDKVIEVGDYYDIENDTETSLLKMSDIEHMLDQIEKGE